MEFYAKNSNSCVDQQIVSIPNGMEFYWFRSLFVYLHYNVSIPNGMEFYLALIQGQAKAKSFNSQRDGILPSSISSEIPRSVSIPNGMEFYFFAKF